MFFTPNRGQPHWFSLFKKTLFCREELSSWFIKRNQRGRPLLDTNKFIYIFYLFLLSMSSKLALARILKNKMPSYVNVNIYQSPHFLFFFSLDIVQVSLDWRDAIVDEEDAGLQTAWASDFRTCQKPHHRLELYRSWSCSPGSSTTRIPSNLFKNSLIFCLSSTLYKMLFSLLYNPNNSWIFQSPSLHKIWQRTY